MTTTTTTTTPSPETMRLPPTPAMAPGRPGAWLRRQLWWMLGPLALLAPCSFRLGHASLWEDEAATVSAIGRPLGAVIDLAKSFDAGNDAYYAALHVWTSVFGTSATALRLPSLLCVALAAAVVAVFAADLAGRVAGALSGLVFAALPAVASVGMTARPAAVGLLLTSLCLLSVHRGVTRGDTRWWVLYFAALTSLCYLTLLGASIVAGFAPFVLLSRHRARIGAWLLTTVAAVALAYPVITLTHRQSGLQSWIPAVSLTSWPSAVGDTSGSTPLTWLLVGVGLLGLGVARREAVLLWGSLLAVPVCLTISSQLFQPVLLSRYLVGALVPLAAIAGVAVASSWRSARVAALVAMVALLVAPLRLAQFHSPATGADFRAAAHVIGQGERPHDAIVFGDWGIYRTGIGYYLQHGPQDVMLSSPGSQTGSLYGFELPESQLATVLAHHRRVWYVEPSAGGPRKAELESLYPRATVSAVQGITVILFRR